MRAHAREDITVLVRSAVVGEKVATRSLCNSRVFPLHCGNSSTQKESRPSRRRRASLVSSFAVVVILSERSKGSF